MITEPVIYISTYFGLMSEQELKEIGMLFHESYLEKGELFLTAGKPCDKLSFVKSSIMRIYSEEQDGEVTQWISAKDQFVTDLSGFIFDVPCRRHIRALSDCQLYSSREDDYRNIGKTIPGWHELEKLFIAKCFTMIEER